MEVAPEEKRSALCFLLGQGLTDPSQPDRGRKGTWLGLQSQSWERVGGAEKCPPPQKKQQQILEGIRKGMLTIYGGPACHLVTC